MKEPDILCRKLGDGSPKMVRLPRPKVEVKSSRNFTRCSVLIGIVLLSQWQHCTSREGFCNTRTRQSAGAARLWNVRDPSIVSELSIMRCAEAPSSQSKKETEKTPKYADDVMPDVTGAVRLYATHTLCISCLACCCQFKRLLPNVKLEVAFDVWRETRRWVGSGEEVLARLEAQERQESK
mmetsp:Transcript_50501/g.80625  ORF Transcript_50501/g.80625 Transcript_50501/m.80625 type:complete len:181 (+) Transcript_50501:47-589(+)